VAIYFLLQGLDIVSMWHMEESWTN